MLLPSACHQLKSADFGRAVCGNKRRTNGKPLEYPHIELTHFKVRLNYIAVHRNLMYVL